MNAANGAWYVLLTEPQRESTAVAGLIARRVLAYGPTFMKKMVQRGRKVDVCRPLFPGYIFARMVEGVDDFGLPRRVVGVRDYMRHEGRFCSISDAAKATIDKREQYELERFHRKPAPFQIGEPVRIADGPFAGISAEVFGLDDQGRVDALVNLFGRKTKVKFEGEQLEKV